MSASRAAGRVSPRFAGLMAVAFALGLAGCDAADPHVPAVVRAPAAGPAASSASPSSTQAAVSRNGLAPPVMHTVD